MDTLIYALDNDNDVFERDTEINSDPWFGKQGFSGKNTDFSLINPNRFIDQIYGSPFGLSQAKLNYGELYGLDQTKFGNPSKGFEQEYSGSFGKYGGVPRQFGNGPSQYEPATYGNGPAPYGNGPSQNGNGPSQYGNGPSQYGN